MKLLIEARAKIADPAHWTQGANARNSFHESCLSHDPRAICWCAQGAILSFRDPTEGEAYTQLNNAAKELTNYGLTSLNDTTDHATVLKMFDIAIERAS